MKRANVPDYLDKIIRNTMRDEGGVYTEPPHDHPTMWGCRQQDLDDCGINESLHELTFDQAY